MSIGEQRSFRPYTEQVYRDPERKAGRLHFARNVSLNDGLLGDYDKQAACPRLDALS